MRVKKSTVRHRLVYKQTFLHKNIYGLIHPQIPSFHVDDVAWQYSLNSTKYLVREVFGLRSSLNKPNIYILLNWPHLPFTSPFILCSFSAYPRTRRKN